MTTYYSRKQYPFSLERIGKSIALMRNGAPLPLDEYAHLQLDIRSLEGNPYDPQDDHKGTLGAEYYRRKVIEAHNASPYVKSGKVPPIEPGAIENGEALVRLAKRAMNESLANAIGLALALVRGGDSKEINYLYSLVYNVSGGTELGRRYFTPTYLRKIEEVHNATQLV